jgi:hypothetical protein
MILIVFSVADGHGWKDNQNIFLLIVLYIQIQQKFRYCFDDSLVEGNV